jgi:hypothetical protein
LFPWVVAGILSGLVRGFANDREWLDGLRVLDVNVVVALVYLAFVGRLVVVRCAGGTPVFVAWAGLVVVAWVAAPRVGVATLEGLEPQSVLRVGRGDVAWAGGVAGLVGGAIHAVANAALLPATRSLRGVLTVAAVGALAGTTTAIDANLWVPFIGWQGAVAGATGYVVEKA